MLGSVPVTLIGSNFGLNPVITFNGQAAVVISNNHTVIVVTLPAGEGTPSIVVRVGSASSASFTGFRYSAPQVTSIAPTTSSTQGNIPMIVQGTNFGFTGTVSVGGSDCVVTSRFHTNITCTIPAGQGTSLAVVVTNSGQNGTR